MVKHGASHAGAVFASFISSGLLIRSFYDELPKFYTSAVDQLYPFLRQCGLYMSKEMVLSLFPLVLLSFIWGAAFKLLHRDEVKSDA